MSRSRSRRSKCKRRVSRTTRNRPFKRDRARSMSRAQGMRQLPQASRGAASDSTQRTGCPRWVSNGAENRRVAVRVAARLCPSRAFFWSHRVSARSRRRTVARLTSSPWRFFPIERPPATSSASRSEGTGSLGPIRKDSSNLPETSGGTQKRSVVDAGSRRRVLWAYNSIRSSNQSPSRPIRSRFLHRGGGRAEPLGVSLLRRFYGRTQSHHRLVQRSEALVGVSRGDAGSARTGALRAFRRHHLGE